MIRGIVECNTDIPYGLHYRPSFGEKQFNKIDLFTTMVDEWPIEHWTRRDDYILRRQIQRIQPSSILEIGVHRPESGDGRSSTRSLLEEKSPECMYLGIDVEDRKDIISWGYDNVHFLQINSIDLTTVMNKFKILGSSTIDFLFIDGHHSIAHTLFDWKYAEFLNKRMGCVGFHDTNLHPGPCAIYDAIDEDVFDKERFFEGKRDWGVGFATHRCD